MAENERIDDASLPAEEDAALPAAQDEPVGEEDIDPADVQIFGLPRRCFHGAAIGFACGYIINGLIGLAGLPVPSATVCGLACALVGYGIARHFDKKRIAAKQQTNEDS